MNFVNDSKNRLRVGIITFHRAINYGALLQTYALQEAFKKMGCECNIIDYRSAAIESGHKELKLADCRNWQDLGRFIFYSKYHNDKFKKFRNFSAAHLNLSHPYYSIVELRKETSEYDRFICGSDQVWNCKITNFDKSYFLDFCEDILKKNSYAASFGFNSIPAEYIEYYKALLKNFNYIAVREWQGNAIINALIERNAEVVLDPTMLITKSEWESIARDYKKVKNYILVYGFGRLTATMKIFLEELVAQTGCKIVHISYSLLKPIKATYEKTVGPTEFLGLFKNARYVVTNSFHGTCFSIIFNKDFFLEMLPVAQGVNSRLENILDVFDLRTRQIERGTNDHIKEAIDYDHVNAILHKERQKSLAYLQKVIQA